MPQPPKFHLDFWRRILLSHDYSDIVCWSSDGRLLIIKDTAALHSLVKTLHIAQTGSFEAIARQMRGYHWRKLRGNELREALKGVAIPAGSEVWEHPTLTAKSDERLVRTIKRRLSPKDLVKEVGIDFPPVSTSNEIPDFDGFLSTLSSGGATQEAAPYAVEVEPIDDESMSFSAASERLEEALRKFMAEGTDPAEDTMSSSSSLLATPGTPSSSISVPLDYSYVRNENDAYSQPNDPLSFFSGYAASSSFNETDIVPMYGFGNKLPASRPAKDYMSTRFDFSFASVGSTYTTYQAEQRFRP